MLLKYNGECNASERVKSKCASDILNVPNSSRIIFCMASGTVQSAYASLAAPCSLGSSMLYCHVIILTKTESVKRCLSSSQ